MAECVLAVDSLEHLVTVELCSQSGAQEEGSGVLSEYGVTLLRRWGESVSEDGGDHPVDPCHHVLSRKVEGSVRLERFSKNQDRLVVGS